MNPNCPICGREAEPAGEATLDELTLLIYQCDTCTRTVEMFGKTYPAAVTFAVSPAGEIFDPATFRPWNPEEN